ncbi:electron transport complex subunit RsxE [Coriobacteriia bacterium Es71-Z0120]|uniref:electron transport complex subunit RsxE n=1 Tax=Parvivirga hydrogeniphila TaxID=2939460 RepID=UPI002260AF3B|nr:electron transport complex subunit RsxE [Parvivirga hydrogeniphila]MCL4078955.1 electron transport complex subunit RsxE [Parvivirga hydrogeniphila]
MKHLVNTFVKGVTRENPLMVLMIGLCATLAVSTQFQGAVFMGIAVIFVLTMSNAIIAAFRRFIPSEVRIPMFIVVIASFVTIVDLVMKAFVPSVYAFLGIWIPLIVVNCMILGRAEAFAYHNGVFASIADGLGMGTGYSLVIVLFAFVRELLGSGAVRFLGATLIALPGWYAPPAVILLFPGAFILYGLYLAAWRSFVTRRGSEGGGCA